jgi:hypothetical protein
MGHSKHSGGDQTLWFAGGALLQPSGLRRAGQPAGENHWTEIRRILSSAGEMAQLRLLQPDLSLEGRKEHVVNNDKGHSFSHRWANATFETF